LPDWRQNPGSNDTSNNVDLLNKFQTKDSSNDIKLMHNEKSSNIHFSSFDYRNNIAINSTGEIKNLATTDWKDFGAESSEVNRKYKSDLIEQQRMDEKFVEKHYNNIIKEGYMCTINRKDDNNIKGNEQNFFNHSPQDKTKCLCNCPCKKCSFDPEFNNFGNLQFLITQANNFTFPKINSNNDSSNNLTVENISHQAPPLLEINNEIGFISFRTQVQPDIITEKSKNQICCVASADKSCLIY